jgi:hypothetical protein
MRKILLLFAVALLALEPAAARVFYYADEVDYGNNVGYALTHPYDGIDADDVGDFDKYSCISLDDYNGFANADEYDGYEPLTASSASHKDLKRLRRDDQLRLVNEDPYDSLDRDDIDNDYDDWDCYTLRDYNSRARENKYDSHRVVDFTHFDDIYEVQKIGTRRYNDFYIPSDFDRFNLQHTRGHAPYYEPYEFRTSPYPLYGYGISRREDY